MKESKCASLIFISGACLLIMMFQCSLDVAGTGTETSTKDSYACVRGKLVDLNGLPAQGVKVQLFPIDHNPVVDSAPDVFTTDITNENGLYSVYAQNDGFYNLQAITIDSSMAFISGLALETICTLEITEDTVREGGSLIYSPPSSQVIDGGYIYIPGTSFFKTIQNGNVLFANVPLDTLPGLIYMVDVKSDSQYSISGSFTISAKDTVHIFSAILVVGVTDNLIKNDSLIFNNIKSLGGAVSLLNDDSLWVGKYSGASVVIISSTCDPAKLDTFFTDQPIPVLVCELNIYDAMHFTGVISDTDYGYQDSQTVVEIIRPAHFIASGLAGEITVFDSAQSVAWGLPGTGAEIIAVCRGSNTRAALFCYDKGALMVGKRAPARRAGIFLDKYNSVLGLNETGWSIFKNTVLWCIGR